MLAVIFFVIALFYATVGFGGGSSYLAVLAVSGIPFLLMPKIALVCNLLVVSGGTWHFYQKGHFNQKLILPFVFSSVPMAFLGGMYPIKEQTFMLLLSSVLVVAGARLLFIVKYTEEQLVAPSLAVSLVIGALLGFLSGLVALGGGIFLAPLLLNLKWGKPKEVAAAASLFIFLNSIAGLLGQLTKGIPDNFFDYWPLFMAVILGGQIGSRISTHHKISQQLIQTSTAVLILVIGIRLLFKNAI